LRRRNSDQYGGDNDNAGDSLGVMGEACALVFTVMETAARSTIGADACVILPKSSHLSTLSASMARPLALSHIDGSGTINSVKKFTTFNTKMILDIVCDRKYMASMDSITIPRPTDKGTNVTYSGLRSAGVISEMYRNMHVLIPVK